MSLATIGAGIHDILACVGMLELDVARIDQSSIAKRFDAIEGKIDKFYNFLVEHLIKLPPLAADQLNPSSPQLKPKDASASGHQESCP